VEIGLDSLDDSTVVSVMAGITEIDKVERTVDITSVHVVLVTVGEAGPALRSE
jgi:hypothetical protein